MNSTPDPSTGDTSTDPNPYIRTYAKDLAAMSGNAGAQSTQPVPAAAAPVKTVEKPHADESLITHDSDGIAPIDLSELENQAESIDARTERETPDSELPQNDEFVAPISLPKIIPGDIVAHAAPTPAPVPVFIPEVKPQPKKETPHQVVENPIFAPIIPTPVVAQSTDNVDKDREAILARLKARVESHKPEPVHPIAAPVVVPPTPPAPQPKIAPVPEPLPTPAPTPEPIREAVIPPAAPTAAPTSYREPIPVEPIPVPVPPPLPPRIPSAPHEEPEALHTYKSDFADHLETQGASAFSVLAAEKDARPARIAPRKNQSGKILATLGAVLLIVGGIGGLYEAYVFMNKNAPVAIFQAPQTPIIPDSSVALAGTGGTLLEALAGVAAEQIPANHVVNTYVTVSTTTSQGTVEEPNTGGAFITELQLPAPDILLRNIAPNSMVGVVNAGGETRAFFVIRVTSYERTFSGMLSWESTMQQTLALLYPRYTPAAVTSPIATVSTTTTATTTVATTTKSGVTKTTVTTTAAPIFVPSVDDTVPSPAFTDEVVANHDTRVLTDLGGRTLLIYGYADQQTLIIARNEAAFTILLARLQANAGNN